ncbi:MAG: NAD-dependent epimerase/dehydratase family protein [Phycisphaerae bacterium]|nr:NAD-dependent epimerase/dehydratase family protein [Phycisphaerae bacterium]NUQ45698.1 NAD-dependent epimerase/dehydratase family protein [Phycisphaerae bacterium]
MNVLITGSSGQIGTNLALALLARGDRVDGIDIRPNTWTDKIPTRLLDLCKVDPDELAASKSVRYDVVVHLAAYAKVFELVEHPERAMRNIQMVFAALEFCRRRQVPVIFGSSREVYGDIHRHVTEENAADFVVAESPYSASKISGEAMIYSYAECYDLPYLVFRFSNVYGRYDNDLDRMERVIPLFARKIMVDEPITVYGREKVLDFTYVDDCVAGVRAAIDALTARRVTNQTINLAYGQGNSLDDVVNLIMLALGKSPQVTYEPARRGEVTRYVADISKARTLLGYKPTTPLTAGLPKAVQWYRESGMFR